MSTEPPYFKKRVSRTVFTINPNFPMDQLCANEGCGHTYHRHFDPYENWEAVGCKYCECMVFSTRFRKRKNNLQCG
jgi:hypothetical protein